MTVNNCNECVCELPQYTKENWQWEGHFKDGGKYYNALPKLKKEFKYNFWYNPDREELHVDIRLMTKTSFMFTTMFIKYKDPFGTNYYKSIDIYGRLTGFYNVNRQTVNFKSTLIRVSDELKTARYKNSTHVELFPFEEE